MIQYHLDQHVSGAIAHGLRLREIEVTTTFEAGLQDASDLEHIVYARTGGRVIFTQDDDFLRHHQAGIQHAGIVYSRQGARKIGEIVRYLKLLHDCLEMEDIMGPVEFF